MSKSIDLAFLQSYFGVTAKAVTPLKSNVALLTHETGDKTIFKCARTDKGGSMIDKFRFKNEIRIYKFLEGTSFHHLHVPKLFAAGKDHIIIDFIERDEMRQVTDSDFAKAYYELQTIQVPFSIKYDLFNQITRGVWYRGIVVPLVSLTKYTSLKKSLSAVRLFLKLHFQNPKLQKRYWLHGDLAVRNVYYHQKDKQLFFIDFENMSYTRKWPLLEIVHRCICYGGDQKGSFQIDLTLLKKYIAYAKDQNDQELVQIHMANQFRLSLLLNCVSKIVRPKTKNKTSAYKSFLNLLLSDSSYHAWFGKQIEPILYSAELNQKTVPITSLNTELSN